MTSADSILQDLRVARDNGEWVCGSYWYATYRPTFSQRISIDLQAKRGYVIESRVCTRHEHNGGIHEYRLVAEPAPKQLQLTG
jgi:hypothetical protein